MNFTKHALLVLLTLMAASSVLSAEDEFRPEWVASCKFGSTDFSIQFKSKSGHADQDDQVATLRWGKGKATTLPIAPGLFESAKFASDAKNYCREIGAFDWPSDRLLLLIPQNNRPSSDLLIAVVIDAKTGAFVQNAGEIGSYASALWLLKQGSGYRVLLERAWYLDPTSQGEFPAPDWLQLYEERGQLAKKWETSRK